MHPTSRSSPPHEFRKRYGDAIADIVAGHSARGAPRASHPAPRDIKAALQSIAADPDAADLSRLDALTRALLMDPAWRRLRVQSPSALTGVQLADCARYALDHFPARAKSIHERGEVALALALLAAARSWHAARRNKLVRDALSAVFQVDYVRATAIMRRAHRELHAGG